MVRLVNNHRVSVLDVTSDKRLRAAIYTRISADKTGGGLAVERQEEDCREVAERLGATVSAVLADNDISAYSGKPRPSYKRLLAMVESGAIDIVIVWHTDRLHRSPVELETWITAAERHGVAVHSVKAGPLDLATPTGRMVARQLGAVARYEVEHLIERCKAAKTQAAHAGTYRGGRRPFGYDKHGTTVVPAEAAIVVDLTERLLRGESVKSLTRDLNDRGIATTMGKSWSPNATRKLIQRARNAGLVEVDGEILTDVTASWPAIVEPSVWRAATRLLDDPSRRNAPTTSERFIGSGTYLCGVCDDGTPMIAGANTTVAGAKRTAYRCRNSFHVTRSCDQLDEFVSGLVLERLSRSDALTLLTPREGHHDLDALHMAREDASGRLAELATLFASRAITAAQLGIASTGLLAEVESIDATLSAASAGSPLAGLVGAPDVAAAWEALSVARRKAVIRTLVAVSIMPAKGGRPKGWTGGTYFDVSAVRVTWLTP